MGEGNKGDSFPADSQLTVDGSPHMNRKDSVSASIDLVGFESTETGRSCLKMILFVPAHWNGATDRHQIYLIATQQSHNLYMVFFFEYDQCMRENFSSLIAQVLLDSSTPWRRHQQPTVGYGKPTDPIPIDVYPLTIIV